MKGYEQARIEVHLRGDESSFGQPRVVTVYNVKSVKVLEGINALYIEERWGEEDDPHHHIVHHNFPLQNVMEWQRVWIPEEKETEDNEDTDRRWPNEQSLGDLVKEAIDQKEGNTEWRVTGNPGSDRSGKPGDWPRD